MYYWLDSLISLIRGYYLGGELGQTTIIIS